MDLWTHFWTLYFEGKIRDLKVNIDLYTTGSFDLRGLVGFPSKTIQKQVKVEKVASICVV